MDFTESVLYEDESILVCIKPAGIATQTKRFGQPDMESRIKNYRAGKGEEAFVGLVHRLDQPVSGVMVFGKTKKATAGLSRQVAERSIGKHYYAVGVCQKGSSGEALPKEGSLTDYIAFDRKTNVSRIVSQKEAPSCDGKKALLDYTTVWEKEKGGECYRLYDVTLHTGRHHQIRLQLQNAGWPLVGDQKYNAGAGHKTGLCLCSYRIEFIHPDTKEPMCFTMDCPEFGLGL